MIRTTSAEAYYEIKNKGLLGKMREQVYDTVYHYGPMTSAEAYLKMIEGKPVKSISQSRARFTELRDMGVLKEMVPKKCSVTGKRAIVWDITGNLPTELPKKRTKKEIKAEVLDLLEKHTTLFNHRIVAEATKLVGMLSLSKRRETMGKLSEAFRKLQNATSSHAFAQANAEMKSNTFKALQKSKLRNRKKK